MGVMTRDMLCEQLTHLWECQHFQAELREDVASRACYVSHLQEQDLPCS